METASSGCCHFRVSHFWVSSINVPQREMLLNILVAYKWLHFYINSLFGKKREKRIWQSETPSNCPSLNLFLTHDFMEQQSKNGIETSTSEKPCCAILSWGFFSISLHKKALDTLLTSWTLRMPFGFRNLAPLNIPVIRKFKQILTSMLLLNSCVFAMSSSLLKDTIESSFDTAQCTACWGTGRLWRGQKHLYHHQTAQAGR